MNLHKRAITYGTFDMFHIGHLELLKRMKTLATEVVVAVSTDEFNEVKGKKTIIPYDQRSQIIDALVYVDKVIPENSWNQKINDVQNHDIDLFVMGDDWEGKFDFLKTHCDILYLPRTGGISSSKLKTSLDTLSSINTDEINQAFEILKRIKENLE